MSLLISAVGFELITIHKLYMKGMGEVLNGKHIVYI